MTQYPKRLIEVDLPIKRISIYARKEKDSRCGHIPRLHIYPAARPLAACRAVMCAALWPDPGDKRCPEKFRTIARKTMKEWVANHLDLVTEESYNKFISIQKEAAILDDNLELRNILLCFIADFSLWKNGLNKQYIKTAHILTKVAHEELGSNTNTKPLIIDPFSGGGAIPLEALRLNCDVFASDTNPLSILINKVVLQYAPKFGKRIADELEQFVKEINPIIKKKLSKYYPNENGNIPIAYLWARTIISEAPENNQIPIEIPLIRTMWLNKKKKLVALRWKRDSKGEIITKKVNIDYFNGKSILARRPELEIFYPKDVKEVTKGTILRNSATCPITGYTTPKHRVQSQLQSRSGGALDSRLYCIVSIKPGISGRIYSIPSDLQISAYNQAINQYNYIKGKSNNNCSLIPDETLPIMSGVFNAPLYGHTTWGSLFNHRQVITLCTYLDIMRDKIVQIKKENPDYAQGFAAVLGLLLDRLADLNASLCVWQLSTPNTAHVFGRWALPMIMDYGEVNPLAEAGGSPESAVWRISSAIKDISSVISNEGNIFLCSADDHPLPNDSGDIFFTDPPYYNAVPYADISDFFYVWLHRLLFDIFSEYFSTELTPKNLEICEMAGWDSVRYKHKDKAFFENKMQKAIENAKKYLKPSGIGIIVFAHKTTAGWEAMLQAIINAGWTITASWPIDTEMASRMRAKNSAALASSIHLVCRPRQTNEIGDWRDVLAELPKRIHEWMPRLSEEGIVGADAIFACLGPALEIFSRYSKVEKASGELVTLKEYLEQVWAAVAKEALTMIFTGADASGFEEDSRLTAMWLWTLKTADSNGNNISAEDEGKKGKTSSGFALEYDAARKIAQGLGAHLENLKHLVLIKGDTAILLPVTARTKHLFGKDTDSPKNIKTKKREPTLFDFDESFIEQESESWKGDMQGQAGKTVLDQLHQCMLLFAANRSEALKRFLIEEGIGNNPLFWRLAQSLSALYPTGTDEKRWVDGLLAKKKGFGF